MPATFTMPMKGGDEITQRLAALNRDMQTKVAWAASAAGAKVVRDKARANASALFIPGPGHLVENIVYARQSPAVDGAYKYAVAVRAGAHARRSARVVGHLRKFKAGVRYTYPNNPWYWWEFEFGFTHYKHSTHIKMPFITPAMTSERDRVLDAMTSTVARRLNRLDV
jgi:HK97 gp10 family phage protein